jgi:hypothetical protein
MTIGVSAMKLGAGRATMTDVIDMSAGIFIEESGDQVVKGDLLATCYTNKEGVTMSLRTSTTPLNFRRRSPSPTDRPRLHQVMRVLVQEVLKASVTIDAKEVASIGRGFLLFVGFTQGDKSHHRENGR